MNFLVKPCHGHWGSGVTHGRGTERNQVVCRQEVSGEGQSESCYVCIQGHEPAVRALLVLCQKHRRTERGRGSSVPCAHCRSIVLQHKGVLLVRVTHSAVGRQRDDVDVRL